MASCQKNNDAKVEASNITSNKLKTQAVTLNQGFEVGSTSPKSAYDVAPAGSSGGDNVTINGTSWNLYDALIGNTAADRKVGTWSARVRNTGKNYAL
jgi:hypothetical protein